MKGKIPAATVAIAAAVAAVLFSIGCFYYAVDPSWPYMPRCVFKTLTGYDCPGCGLQRALHALLHGDVALAWSCNAFVFFAVPVALFYIVVELGRRRWPRLHYCVMRPWIIAAITASIAAWWLLRNL